MNQRPTRAAPPPNEHQDTAVQERATDFVAEAQPVARLPARTDAEIPVAKTVSARVEEPEEELPATGPGAVIAAIAAIMAEIKPIEKSGWNDFHKYWHVRMQDLSRELTPLMGKHGIVVFQTEDGRELFDNGNAVAVRYRFSVVHKSGAIWPQRPLQTGVSSCRSTKGGFDDKALNKCHTAARKYFLLSLFQLASEDSEDADGAGPADGGKRPQGPQARRPAPSPSGKLPPHLLPIIDGEAPEAWATRFKPFIEKAETEDEVNRWYDTNLSTFEKLKARFPVIYDGLVDVMDAKVAKLSGSIGEPTKDSSSTFPADRPLPAQDDLDIPAALDRRPKKPAADGISDKDREWLLSLTDAFKECGDLETLTEEQRSIMLPHKDSVGGTAWNKAVDILNARIEEIEGKNG